MNAKTLKMVCDEIAKEGRMAISTVRAKDSVEALLRIYGIEKAPIAEFREQVTAVLTQRLVRKLCDKCKEPYTPPAEVLKQLGLPADKVKAFFRPPTVKSGDEDKKGDLPRVRRRGLPGPDGHFRIDGGRRPGAEDAGREPQARCPAAGRAEVRHQDAAGGRDFDGRSRRHVAAGVDAGVERVRDEG